MTRLISNIMKKKVFKHTPLRGVDFAVDFACNLKCRHCFNASLFGQGKKMDLADYRRIINEAIELGAVNFAFQGGEILLFKDLDRLLSLVDSSRYSLSITTNGILLDEENVERLRDHGVNTITISIDSGIAEEHDNFRGKIGAYNMAIAGIDFALAHKIKVVINTVVTPESLHSKGFIELVDYSQKNKILLNTIFAAPSGKWAENDTIILRNDDINYYNSLRKSHPFIVRDIDSGYSEKGCQGGAESLYVTPFGDVLGCPYIHIRAGNVFEENLAVIRTRAMRYFHYQKKCMIAENAGFIREYVDVTRNKELPLPQDHLEKIKSWD